MDRYLTQHQALVNYLVVKVDQRDWHGVADAANDLRVLEAENAAMLGAIRQGESNARADEQRAEDPGQLER